MTSPLLSRSPSATFAPGPHRRSHPNLQTLHHLSLAPLTPKYPIDPADYDAYHDPHTAELHTSASLSHIASLPSPGGILTNSPARSRNPSRTRARRKLKSTVHIQVPSDEAERTRHGGLGDEHAAATATAASRPQAKPAASKSRPQLQLHLHKLQVHTDPSWLVQTGLSLTESSRETKGQSWISKRDSSTSLAGTPEGYGYGYNFEGTRRPRDGPAPRSGRATPAHARSRVTSRNGSRNTSRSRLAMGDLRMTANATSPAASMKGTPNASFATAPDGSDRVRVDDLECEDVDVEPNWADASTRAEAEAELAAQLQSELADEFEAFSEGFDGDGDGDPYGMLDFENQGESEDEENAEEEVRRAMRRWRVGGWMDGAIDALLMVEETTVGLEGEETGGKGGEIEERRVSGDDSVEGPEERVRGAWPDLRWFGRVISRQVNI